jgi:hypothetical protein
MKRTVKNYSLKLLVIVAATAPLFAQADSSSTYSVDDNFRFGWHEFTFGGASFYANVIRGSNRPNLDYAMGYAEAGFMVTEPKGDSFFRGSFELVPEIFGATIHQGPGSYIAGATLWFRYNFVPQDWKFVPYLELGGGGTTLDIPHNYDGKDFNFNLDAALGFHYFIAPRCALNAEYRFQHISNADLWDRNIGVNATGPAVGVSFFF